MKPIVRTLLSSAMGLAALSVSAKAADMIETPVYEPAPEVVPVEIGSGWYLRGDVSYDFKSKYDGSYRTFGSCGGTCTPAYATADYDEWEIDSGLDFGVGAGYQFTDYFRGDLTANYWQHDVTGHDKGYACGTACGSDESADVRAWELMANAYVDVGTLAGITPYFGAGIGGVHVKYSDFDSQNYDGHGTHYAPDTFEGEDSWRFAYALMAGASYDLSQSLKLDVGYRYVNVDDGEMFGKNKLGGVVSGKDNGFDRHTIQAGLRYQMW